MSSSKKLLQSSSGFINQSSSGLNIEDVFSIDNIDQSNYTYDGSSTRTIANGMDFTYPNDGMVWIKSRTSSQGHSINDSERGAGAYLTTNNNAATSYSSYDNVTGFYSNGFGYKNGYVTAQDYVAYTFMRANNFFDVTTWTGDGTTNRSIPHALGQVPGMIIAKKQSGSGDWHVLHRSATMSGTGNSSSGGLKLNQNGASTYYTHQWEHTYPTDSVFKVSHVSNASQQTLNTTGEHYVAYLFGHDTSNESLIQCGSFQPTTTGSSGNGGVLGTEVDLGWQPQWLMYKKVNSSGDWYIIDTFRGWCQAPISWSSRVIKPNDSTSETNVDNGIFVQTKGFQVSNSGYFPHGSSSDTFIYVAIRRGPMAEPTAGTDVYKGDFKYSTQAQALHPKHRNYTNWPVDWTMELRTNQNYHTMRARLFGESNWFKGSQSNPTDTTNIATNVDYFASSKGTYSNIGSSSPDTQFCDVLFRCHPKVFDMGSYNNIINNGTSMNLLGNAGQWSSSEGLVGGSQIKHNLKAVPEMIMVRRIFFNTGGYSGDPYVWHKDQISIYDGGTAGKYEGRWNVAEQHGYNTVDGTSTNGITNEVFTVSSNTDLQDLYSNQHNVSFYTYWMWASYPGISKVGSFTGDTTNGVTVNCGFQPRFILLRITNPTTASNGSWKLFCDIGGLDGSNSYDRWWDMAGGTRVDDHNAFTLSSSGFNMTASSSYPSIHETGKRHCFLALA